MAQPHVIASDEKALLRRGWAQAGKPAGEDRPAHLGEFRPVAHAAVDDGHGAGKVVGLVGKAAGENVRTRIEGGGRSA